MAGGGIREDIASGDEDRKSQREGSSQVENEQCHKAGEWGRLAREISEETKVE